MNYNELMLSLRRISFAAIGAALLASAGCAATTWTDDRPGILDEYAGLPSQKAMAVAIEPDGRYVWAHGNGYRDVDEAIDRAMQECERFRAEHGIGAPCELYRVNDQPQ